MEGTEAAAVVRPAEGEKDKEANKPKTGGSSIGVIKVSFIHLQILWFQSTLFLELINNLPNFVKVSSRQRGNPVLKSIRGVPWEFDDKIVPDYVIGQRACAIFLSVRYHLLNPNYIHERLKEVGSGYELRVLLTQVDVKDPHHALRQLMRIRFGFGLLCALDKMLNSSYSFPTAFCPS